ncbi:S-layer homology domain-containing protein [Paenibacillus sp. MCAF9]|uniref:S-layer homology domain-containing protein n=1 Tax=Paenibacillus sp. MCAF9 TaxID=3233046 RepID=UPI003F9E4023
MSQLKSYRIVALMLIFSMLFTSFSFAAEAESERDIVNHWANKELTEWMDKGWLKGYGDGSIQPNQLLTRAEFVALVNRSFQFTNESELTFQDVPKHSWFYQDVARAVAAGYISGKSAKQFAPREFITRQQAAVVINRLLQLQVDKNAAMMEFSDSEQFAEWAKEAISNVVIHGIMRGYNSANIFKPLNPLTRAELVVILDRSLQVKLSQLPIKPENGNVGGNGNNGGNNGGNGNGGVTSPVKEENTPFKTEITVRTVNQFRSASDVADFVEQAVKYNVDIINMSVKQDEDDEVPSGHVFYNSAIAPIADGYESFDALSQVITQAHLKGIEVRAWIPQFHDQAAFHKDPSWQMHALVDGNAVPYTGSNGSEYFVNPIHPDVQAYERSIIEEVVSNYDIDGVVLDWLRFDNYNMDVSSYTVNLYESIYGYSPLDINFDEDSTRRNEWNEWRTDQIGGYVQDVREDIDEIKAGMELGVFILPPEFVEVGQNASKFKDAINFVAPMAYFDDWGFDEEWVYDENGILSDTLFLVGSGVAIVPTLDDNWTDDEYQAVYGGIRESFPTITHLSYFNYGAWDWNVLKAIDARRAWPTAGWEPPVEHDYNAVLPQPWKARNIGLKTGDASYDAADETFTLTGSSTDIWGNNDLLNYIYKPLHGDGSIIAQVTVMEEMSEWAKAGLMIRETLDVDAKHVDMMVTPVNGATFQYRENEGGGTVDQTMAGSPPLWLKLNRSGNVFTGSISDNGVDWTVVSSFETNMNDDVYIGLALSNPASTSDNKAVYTNVQVIAGDEGK